MFEKNKTYTYDEIQDIILTASAKATKNLDEKTKDLEDETGMARMMFSMQNMMVMSSLMSILFNGDKNGNN